MSPGLTYPPGGTALPFYHDDDDVDDDDDADDDEDDDVVDDVDDDDARYISICSNLSFKRLMRKLAGKYCLRFLTVIPQRPIHHPLRYHC